VGGHAPHSSVFYLCKLVVFRKAAGGEAGGKEVFAGIGGLGLFGGVGVGPVEFDAVGGQKEVGFEFEGTGSFQCFF
jgi:hypothetical protein